LSIIPIVITNGSKLIYHRSKLRRGGYELVYLGLLNNTQNEW